MGIGQHRILEAQPVERAKDVRAELDAGAELLELGRLLQHPHGKALPRQRSGRREAADAATGNQDREVVAHH